MTRLGKTLGGLSVINDLTVGHVSTATDLLVKAGTIIGVTDTSAPRTITLASSLMKKGRIILIKDESDGAGTNNITIATQGAEKIDKVLDFITISVDSGIGKLYSNGVEWFTR